MKGGYKYMGNVKIDKSTQVFLVLGMIVMLAFAGFAAFKDVTVNVAEADIDEDAIAQAVIGAIVLPSDNASGTSDKLDAIYNEMFKDDAWEVESRDLAIEELKDDDYEALFDWMYDNLAIEDEDDISEVIVRDTSYGAMDIDDMNAVVFFELKVYYEDSDGDGKKAYINAIVEIVDEEVEEIDFELD